MAWERSGLEDRAITAIAYELGFESGKWWGRYKDWLEENGLVDDQPNRDRYLDVASKRPWSPQFEWLMNEMDGA